MGVRRLLCSIRTVACCSRPRPEMAQLSAADLTQSHSSISHCAARALNVYGVTVTADIGGRPLLVQVLEDLSHRDVLIDDIVAEFLTRVGWITAPILLILLIIDVVIFRRALRPIIAASALAERIGPAHTELRLPEEGCRKR